MSACLLAGYVFKLARGVVNWEASLQDHVTLLSTEAEYMTLIFIAKEAIWLRGLLLDFVLEHKSVDIHCNKQYVIYLAYNSVYYERIKHIDIKNHFIQDVKVKGKVVIKKMAIVETQQTL